MGARGLPGYSDASHIGRTTTVAFYSLAPTRQHSNPPRFPELGDQSDGSFAHVFK